MKVHEQRNESTYLPRSVTGCRSQGLIRSTSPVSHLKTPHIVNISIENILGPGLYLKKWAVRGCIRKYSFKQKCKTHRRLMSSKGKTWGQKNAFPDMVPDRFDFCNLRTIYVAGLVHQMLNTVSFNVEHKIRPLNMLNSAEHVGLYSG